MIVRAIDENNDWMFGKGIEDYKFNFNAVVQNIKTRLQSFLGDCFFSAGEGIDWPNLLGGKNQIALNLAVSAVILNTDNVTGVIQLDLELSSERVISISYQAATSFGAVSQTVTISV